MAVTDSHHCLDESSLDAIIPSAYCAQYMLCIAAACWRTTPICCLGQETAHAPTWTAGTTVDGNILVLLYQQVDGLTHSFNEGI